VSGVVFNYLRAGLYVVVEFVFAWGLATFFLGKYSLWRSDRTQLVLFLFGTGILLVAGIGRLGWPIQTLGGNSPAEKLDQGIFLLLSLSGTFLLLLDYFLSRTRK